MGFSSKVLNPKSCLCTDILSKIVLDIPHRRCIMEHMEQRQIMEKMLSDILLNADDEKALKSIIADGCKAIVELERELDEDGAPFGIEEAVIEFYNSNKLDMTEVKDSGVYIDMTHDAREYKNKILALNGMTPEQNR